MKIRNSEWNILYMNLVNSGKSKWEAGEIIKKHKEIFNEHYDKLVKKGLSKEDIEIKFRKEFEELVQSLE
ncbi:MAG TPA: hypothetical protein VJ438_02995 [Candidatus Nanoarchaeia archaeon]|nr:hypothetical protein [Candidatus Nanoarchaeia archaeon]